MEPGVSHSQYLSLTTKGTSLLHRYCWEEHIVPLATPLRQLEMVVFIYVSKIWILEIKRRSFPFLSSDFTSYPDCPGFLAESFFPSEPLKLPGSTKERITLVMLLVDTSNLLYDSFDSSLGFS